MTRNTSLAPRASLAAIALMLVLSGVAIAPPDGYESDDTPGTATAITLGTSPTHSISPASDEDWYTFTLTSSASIVLETSGPTGDTVMDLYESDGTTLIDSDDDGGTGSFSRIDRSLATGSYYVRVTSFFSLEIDDYSLTYSLGGAAGDAHEPDDSSATATSLAVGGTSTGHSILPAGDEDWWVFTLPAPATVVLETSGVAGDTVMSLYQSDGTTLITSDDDGGAGTFSRISRSLGAGTYYVRVGSFFSLAIDSYQLSLTSPTGTPAPGGLSPIVWILIIVVIAVVVVVVTVVVLRSRSKRPPAAVPPGPMPGQPWQPMPPGAPPPPGPEGGGPPLPPV